MRAALELFVVESSGSSQVSDSFDSDTITVATIGQCLRRAPNLEIDNLDLRSRGKQKVSLDVLRRFEGEADWE